MNSAERVLYSVSLIRKVRRVSWIRRWSVFMIQRMSSKNAWDLLRDGEIGRLGCIADNYPYVVPVHYIVEGERIYSHSLPGRKIPALRADPRACLQMDQVIDDCHWRSVIAYGMYEEAVNTE